MLFLCFVHTDRQKRRKRLEFLFIASVSITTFSVHSTPHTNASGTHGIVVYRVIFDNNVVYIICYHKLSRIPHELGKTSADISVMSNTCCMTKQTLMSPGMLLCCKA